jgi:hypothetical protein
LARPVVMLARMPALSLRLSGKVLIVDAPGRVLPLQRARTFRKHADTRDNMLLIPS